MSSIKLGPLGLKSLLIIAISFLLLVSHHFLSSTNPIISYHNVHNRGSIEPERTFLSSHSTNAVTSSNNILLLRSTALRFGHQIFEARFSISQTHAFGRDPPALVPRADSPPPGPPPQVPPRPAARPRPARQLPPKQPPPVPPKASPASPPPLDFYTAKCKGAKLYQRVKDSYAANSGRREFSSADIDNGWDRSSQDVPLEDYWREPLSSKLPHGTKHEDLDQNYVILTQTKSFTTESGRFVPNEDPDDIAFYGATYLPTASTIIVSLAQSPTHVLQQKYNPYKPPENLIPPLNRLSDVIWTIWTQVVPEKAQANKLRYIGRDNIANQDSKNIIKGILRNNGRPDEEAPWPGLTFGIEQDEGQALLGTPNGLGVAWLLVDRHGRVGKRRGLQVTIFSSVVRGREGQEVLRYQMLWDLGT